jgi:prolyl 4-hydroxylase
VDPATYTYLFDDGTASAAEKKRWADEKAFDDAYHNRTGRHWVSYYPRPPPALSMWPADFVGQAHAVSTRFTHFDCFPADWRRQWSPPKDAPRRGGHNGMDGGQAALDACRAARGDTAATAAGAAADAGAAGGNLTLTLRVLHAQSPKVFQVDNLFSAAEAEHLIALGAPKVRRSLTGNADDPYESDTRTSKTGWVGRWSSPVVERLFRRAADLLRLDHALLTSERNAEQLQVVHYDPDQKYDAHHDWGVEGGGPSRFVTLLLYLNDPVAGGQTGFPKADLALHPGKGSAILFYNLLEDGNADTETLHAALPVIEGEKWLANFWIWDPVMV